MCGIIACVSKEKIPILKTILNSLKKLEYRGYDSVGVAVIDDSLFIQKEPGKIDDVAKNINVNGIFAKVAIGHTRWATHGKPTQKNAHPHSDCTNSIALVHNGIIENYLELKKELLAKGHVFQSETDTEIIAHLLEEELKETHDFFDAFKTMIKKIKGTYAIAVVSKSDPEKIFLAKKDSPLIIGVGKSQNFAASDIPAILEYTRDAIILHDGEIAVLTAESVYIERNNVPIEPKVVKVLWSPEMAQKRGYPHFMLKEIYEQPIALRNTLDIPETELLNAAQTIVDAENIIFIASGTSYHATLHAKNYLIRHLKKPIYSVIASEYDSLKSLVDDTTLLIPVSQSGETMDVIRALNDLKERKANTLAISNVYQSTVARLANHVIYTQAGPEIGVAATKTYTSQVAVLMLLSYTASFLNGSLEQSEYHKYLEKIRKIPVMVEKNILNSELQARQLAQKIKIAESSFYLARGQSIPTAMEGALKMKEIAYIHAESYPAGESKHGPIALVSENFPVFFVAPRDETEKKILGNIEEMKARGANIILVTEAGSVAIPRADTTFILPKMTLTIERAINLIIPLQLVAYYTAVERGYDPDKPRNLAKTVTVD